MKYLKYFIADPTGGGEDGVLILPEWAAPGATLMVRVGEEMEPVEMPIDPDLDSVEVKADTVSNLLSDW